MSDTPIPSFSDLNIPAPIVKASRTSATKTPSPIQAATIPLLMEGRDVLGQAQTGTGKTAAFALPVLARIDTKQSAPQALVLAPTRELAIQVAEAFQSYAAHMKNFAVLPIYGGQSYGPQLQALRRGVQVIVGTPGRVIDHIQKGSLDLSQLKTLVLDEADEMLRMGFIDDVEQILQADPGRAPDRAVLGHHAVGDQAHRQDLPARSGRSNGGSQDRHRRQHHPALLAGVGHAEARSADAHPGSRAVRRHDHLRPHQARYRRTGDQAAGARFRGRRHQRRHGPAGTRAHHRAAQERQDRHPGRHRRRRARPGRRAHQPRHQLRRAVGPGKLYPPHRPHRPRGPQRRRDPVHHAARAQPAESDRARHAPDCLAADPADHQGRQRRAHRQVQGTDFGNPGRRRPGAVPFPDRGIRAGAERAGGRHRRRPGQTGPRRRAAAAGKAGPRAEGIDLGRASGAHRLRRAPAACTA
jgi:hypothetical protein